MQGLPTQLHAQDRLQALPQHCSHRQCVSKTQHQHGSSLYRPTRRPASGCATQPPYQARGTGCSHQYNAAGEQQSGRSGQR